MVSRVLIVIIALCASCLGQNVYVKFYRDVPVELKPSGIPDLCVHGFKKTSQTDIPPGVSTNFTQAQFDAHLITMEPIYNAWKASVESNRLFQINATLVTLNNLYQTNINFMGLVATSRPAVTVVVLSNQTVTVTRILNQLGPLLKDLYAPKVAAETP